MGCTQAISLVNQPDSKQTSNKTFPIIVPSPCKNYDNKSNNKSVLVVDNNSHDVVKAMTKSQTSEGPTLANTNSTTTPLRGTNLPALKMDDTTKSPLFTFSNKFKQLSINISKCKTDSLGMSEIVAQKEELVTPEKAFKFPPNQMEIESEKNLKVRQTSSDKKSIISPLRLNSSSKFLTKGPDTLTYSQSSLGLLGVSRKSSCTKAFGSDSKNDRFVIKKSSILEEGISKKSIREDNLLDKVEATEEESNHSSRKLIKKFS